MRLTMLLMLAVLAAAPLSAQNIVSYPQDTVDTTGGAGWETRAALGCNWTQNSQPNDWDEGRYQMLIPAAYLPPCGGALVGIAGVNMVLVGPLTYNVLDITVSHTTATTLSTTFATNLPAPVTCLQGRLFRAQYHCCPTMDWSDQIAFTTPFTYDGTSNLVIDFQKVIDRNTYPVHFATFRRSTHPGRGDLPQPIAAWGQFGSGAHVATTAMPRLRYEDTPMLIRLYFSGTPTMKIESPTAASGLVFGLGGTVTVTSYAQAGSYYATSFGVGFVSPPLNFAPLVSGLGYVQPGPTLLSGGISSTGEHAVTLTMPNDASIVGVQLGLQDIVLDPALTLSFTNAVDFVISY